jgi:hypothetical protein
MEADPDDAPAASAEYAADPLWVWSHLGQFAGFAVLGIALIGLTATLEAGRAAAWARIGVAGIAATIAVAAVLQAVDGVALKVMVDRWAAAGAELGDARFEAAIAVRQVEIGLAALLNVLIGFSSAAFSIGMVSSSRYPLWLGAGGLVVAGHGGGWSHNGLRRLLGCAHDDRHAGNVHVSCVAGGRSHPHVALGPSAEQDCRNGRGEHAIARQDRPRALSISNADLAIPDRARCPLSPKAGPSLPTACAFQLISDWTSRPRQAFLPAQAGRTTP